MTMPANNNACASTRHAGVLCLCLKGYLVSGFRSALPQTNLMLCEPGQMGAMGALLDLQLGALTGYTLKQQVSNAVHVHLPGRRKLSQQGCCCCPSIPHSMPTLLDVGSCMRHGAVQLLAIHCSCHCRMPTQERAARERCQLLCRDTSPACVSAGFKHAITSIRLT